MEKLEYIVPCHFGLEAVLKREIADLGYEIVSVEDGRITFAGMRRQSVVPIFFCGALSVY